MLANRLRRWPNIDPKLGKLRCRLMLAGQGLMLVQDRSLITLLPHDDVKRAGKFSI